MRETDVERGIYREKQKKAEAKVDRDRVVVLNSLGFSVKMLLHDVIPKSGRRNQHNCCLNTHHQFK